MLCHNQTPSSTRRTVSLIGASRVNEVSLILVAITVESAENFLPQVVCDVRRKILPPPVFNWFSGIASITVDSACDPAISNLIV
jgi:hypothetical protein